VRISSRLVGEPGWVLDYVIVHELALVSVPRHDARVWALVRRYPRAERARGFLMARGLDAGPDEEPRRGQDAALAGGTRPGGGGTGGRPHRRTSRQTASEAPRLPGF
jgi:hypothetical protein